MTSYVGKKYPGKDLRPFFFNDTATTEIYTLSLHDALPIWPYLLLFPWGVIFSFRALEFSARSEEHTSELQSPAHLVCRLLLETKTNSHRSCAADPPALCLAAQNAAPRRF